MSGQSPRTNPGKVVLHCPHGCPPQLDALVTQFVREGVGFVGVVGPDCARVEDLIDELLVGDGSQEPHFMLTTSHPGESLAEAVAFARSLSDDYGGEPVVVEA